MSATLVQIPKENEQKERSYYTKSGLKRNKRFSAIKPPPIDTPPSSTEKDSNENESLKSLESPIKVESGTIQDLCSFNFLVSEEKPAIVSPRTPPIERPTCKRSIGTSVEEIDDVLAGLIQEEMRISERRRILFCEQPVASLLGLNSHCPFGKEDIRPLKFRNFRKSIRIQLLLIYGQFLKYVLVNNLFFRVDQKLADLQPIGHAGSDYVRLKIVPNQAFFDMGYFFPYT
jgi:hypothetical protein